MLPAKKADAYDPTKPLSSFLQKEYPTEAQKYTDSLTSFHNIRNNAIFANSSSGQLGFHNILRYNYHMVSISKRLTGYEGEIKFAFSWADAFQPSKRCQSGSLHFDWACVLWNLASLESHRGAHLDRSTNEGVRAASVHFQQAAGVFHCLNTEIVPKIKGAKSQELNENFLNVLQYLNLAQAQICFYEKAVRDKKGGTMKAGLVAKLAKQVAKFYDQAVTFSRDKEVTRCIDQSWIYHMDFQRECFQGASEYWQAQAVKEDALATGRGFGEEITRLARAEEIFTNALTLGKSKRVHVATLSTAETFLDAVKRMKFTAVKDNNMIYHDVVPDTRSLSEIAPIPMVKPSPLPSYPTNPNVSPEPPLFADVLPKEVRSLLNQYRERVSAVVNQTESAALNATNSGRSSLSAIGLPGSLEVYKSGGSFPSNLWKKIQQLQARCGKGPGGLAGDLASRVEDLERLADRAKSTMDGIEYSLRREESIDGSFRDRFPNYSGPSSLHLSEDIRCHVKVLMQAYDVARSNDKTMISRVQGMEFQKHLRLLGMTLPELEAQLPSGDGSSPTSHNLVNTSELEEHLVKIATLFEAREVAVGKLKTHVSDFDLAATDAFIEALAGQTNLSVEDTEELLRTQLQALEPLTGAVTATLYEQQKVLEDVAQSNNAFNDARTNDPLQKAREDVIKQLEQGMSAYSQSSSQLNAGSTFYMDMQSRLTSLTQQCDDLSYTQQLQRQEYEVEQMRDQDRENQERSDHDMALRLAEEMDRMNMSQEQQQQVQQQQQRQIPQQQYGYPQLQQQDSRQQQPPLRDQPQHLPFQNGDAGKMTGITYGQPVSGPPGRCDQGRNYQGQYDPQMQYHQQQQPSQISAPPSQSYSSHFQSSSFPNAQSNDSSAPSGYVYNAGFNDNGSQGVTISSLPQQNPQYNPSYQQLSNQQQFQQQQPPVPTYQPPQPQFTGQAQADENKIARLVEMGFPRESVAAYLNANNNDEEAALNGLLSGTSLPPPSGNTNNNQSPPPKPPRPPQTSSTEGSTGFFGKIWGS